MPKREVGVTVVTVNLAMLTMKRKEAIDIYVRQPIAVAQHESLAIHILANSLQPAPVMVFNPGSASVTSKPCSV
jgi:hypothetical protein